MRLRHILFLAFSGVAVLPVLSLATWIYLQAQAREERLVQDTHLLLARNLGGALARYARDVQSGFQLAAEVAVLGTPAAREPMLMLLEDLNFNHLCVADAETGDVRAGIFPESFPCPPRVPESRFAVFKSLAQSEAPVFSPVMPNPFGDPTLYLLMLRGDQLVIGAISTRYFVERGKAIAFGKLGHAAIVDHTGTVLAHPRPDWLKEMKNIAKVKPVAAMLRGETGITTFFSPALEADMVAGYTTVPSTGWGVMIPQPAEEVRDHAGNVQQWALIISGIGLLVAAAISWFLAVLLTRGLTPIADAAARMSAGDLTARARADGGLRPREMVELETAFNLMAVAVAESNAKLSRALKDAEQAAQAKTNFLTTMTHEIRTPMNGVLGVSEILGNTELDTEQAEMVGIINQSAGALLEIVNDVLDISKIEAGQLQIDLQPFEPRELIKTLVQEYQPGAAAKGLTLSSDVDDAIPSRLVSDGSRLRQILVNLVNNAIKFTEAGSVHLSLRLERDDEDRAWLLAKVRDTGIGIDGSTLGRLFQPFSQADPSTTRKYGGTGLGLSICRRLAGLLGGDITVSSTVGEGSTFRLRIPVSVSESPSASPAPANPVSTGPATDPRPGPDPRDGWTTDGEADGRTDRGRVLVAEDHSTNMWILKRQLEELGFTVDGYENGMGALSAFRTADYALVITDYLMPDVDGIGLTRAIRETEAETGRKRTPILGLTANAFRDAIERCVDAGMDLVLTKPVDRGSLVRAIDTLSPRAGAAVPETPAAAGIGGSATIAGRGGESEAGRPAPVFERSTLDGLFADSPAEGRAWLLDYLSGLDEKMAALGARPNGGDREREMALLHGLSGISYAAGALALGRLARSTHDRLRLDPDTRMTAEEHAALEVRARELRQEIDSLMID